MKRPIYDAVAGAPYAKRWDWAAEVIAAATEGDATLARSIGSGELTPIGEGASSMVFEAPRAGRVVRLTSDTAVSECAIIQQLLGRKLVGWTRVFDFAYLDLPSDDPDDRFCIAVVEHVTSADEMRRRTRKREDLIDAAYLVSSCFPNRLGGTPRWQRANSRVKRWARQLYRGLQTINRESIDYELDLHDTGNWGIDAADNAVWIDFGV